MYWEASFLLIFICDDSFWGLQFKTMYEQQNPAFLFQ